MAVFEQASGQGLNASKSLLLPIGDLAAAGPLPAEAGGIKVLAEAGALGVVYTNGGDRAAGVVWEDKVAPVRKRFAKIAKLGLSIFGRANAAGTYGLGRLLYHAEHAGLPGEVGLALRHQTVALVDKGLGPGAAEKWVPGVPSRLLVGKPKLGGFACCPLPSTCWRAMPCWHGSLLSGRRGSQQT